MAKNAEQVVAHERVVWSRKRQPKASKLARRDPFGIARKVEVAHE